jgi:alpha-glucosidase
MTNWTARDLDLDLEFLGSGSCQADIYRDGPNADRVGIDYQREIRRISSTDRLRTHLAPGGGWAARVKQK